MTARMSAPSVPLVDVRAARLAQATTAVLVGLALFTRSAPLLVLPLAHLAASAALGRRGNLPVVLHARLTGRTRSGERRLEDARPLRFAAVVGTSFVAAALAAHAMDLPRAGWALAGVVALLAGIAATTGLCVGCEAYRFAAALRGVRAGAPGRIDLAELAGPAMPATAAELVVQFTHPLCSDCHALEERLVREGHQVVRVDVSRRPDLARKYGVSVVPLAYAVAPDGRVARRVR